MEKDQKIIVPKGLVLDYLSSGSPIFQVEGLYTFSSDSIALAHAVQEQQIETLVDLCAGSGVVGLEIADTRDVKNLYLVELQSELADAANISARLTTRKTKIKVINDDIKNAPQLLGEGCADVVISNPPYFKSGSGEVPENLSRALARHELKMTLLDLVSSAARLLKSSGMFYMIHIASREKEIEKTLRDFDFKIVSKSYLKGKLSRIIVIAKKEHKTQI